MFEFLTFVFTKFMKETLLKAHISLYIQIIYICILTLCCAYIQDFIKFSQFLKRLYIYYKKQLINK